MTVARWLAVPVALAAGIAAGAHVTALDAGEPWRTLQEALRPDGLGIITVSLVWLVAGALVQTPVALRRDARVGTGWMVILWLVAITLVVAVLLATVLLALVAGDLVTLVAPLGLPIAYGWTLLYLQERFPGAKAGDPLE
ncbi:hypothetical protein [Actinoplanes couchii]|uniref:Integral membrane protein n=1 Tax=Actinoplanes couchii TaxID=403638 RepID=A0ABQ3XDV8_9ACTN|nr:hypothetical protein [Actinoplanes couchii]MDR6317204.1 drug/metabolite transporter (DMT)-like permease [Actinoplanes couchii]GID56696.1 hypothetical protein Aco03nite_051000 [Actinoplanes couchii]